MEDVGTDEPVQSEISARLSRLGAHFEVLAGLGVGSSFEEAAATCKAGADEIQRLHEATRDLGSGYDWMRSKPRPAARASARGDRRVVSNRLEHNPRLDPQFGQLLLRQIERTFGPYTGHVG